MRNTILTITAIIGLAFSMNAQSYYKLDNTEMRSRIFIKQELKTMVKNPRSIQYENWHFERRGNKAYAIYTFYAKNSFGADVRAKACQVIGLNSDGSIRTATEVIIRQ